MKIKTILLVAATVGLSLPSVAMAQEMVGKNGHVVDGSGGAGKTQNEFVYDGQSPDISRSILLGLTARAPRTDVAGCDLYLDPNCTFGHTKKIPTDQ